MNNDVGKQLGGLFRSPKTILSFFAIVLGILGLTVYGLASAFSEIDKLQFLIPWILGFGAIFIILICLAILITSWINPEKLMLGEVQGEVYLQMMQVKQGDSDAGEFIDSVAIKEDKESPKKIAPHKQNSALEDDAND